jgi:hypothetical protein
MSCGVWVVEHREPEEHGDPSGGTLLIASLPGIAALAGSARILAF